MSNGWHFYLGDSPDPEALVRFKNERDGQEWTGRAMDLHPYFNVAYLLWKLTGIEEERRLNDKSGAEAPPMSALPLRAPFMN